MVLSSVNMGPAHTPLAGRRAARVAGGERAPPPRPSRPRAGAGPRARRVCATRHLPLSPRCWARSGSSEVWRRRAGPRVRTVAAGARGVRAHLGMAPRTSDWAPKDTFVPCVSVSVCGGGHPARPRDPLSPGGPAKGHTHPLRPLPLHLPHRVTSPLLHAFCRPLSGLSLTWALASPEKSV